MSAERPIPQQIGKEQKNESSRTPPVTQVITTMYSW